MSITLTFEVLLQSDYHVSAGQRGGLTVDSVLLRDYDTAPVLRGTMIAGLLRDGLEDLKSLMASSSIPAYQPLDEAGERLFGSAEKMKRWAFSSARPSEPLLNAQSKANARWGSKDTARVRINPRTRRSAPQQLFFEEEGDARLRFQFTAVCDTDTTQNEQDAFLLTAAARMVRHLGAARRRGRGQCRIKLINAGDLALNKEDLTASALAQFKTNWLTQLESIGEAQPAREENPPLALTGCMKRFRLVGQLREPLLIARRSEAANAYETLPFVPGTTVLGALATRAAHHLDLQKNDQAPVEFIQLFLRGAVQTTPLTLAAVDDQELSPAITAPRSFFQCENYPAFQTEYRGKRHPLHNGLDGDPPAACPKCGGKMKAVNGFVQLNDEKLLLAPQKREEMHIKMNRETGRANEGDLYEYIALEAGQWLTGDLQCDSGSWSRLQALTGVAPDKKMQIRLGKASRRGYGLLEFVLLELDEGEVPTAILQPFNTRVPSSKTEELSVSLLLLSDCIMLDKWGRHYHGFDADWLEDSLGGATNSVIINKQYCNTRLIDSFNGHRRLPRWRDEAIEAGSTAQITIKTNDMPTLLAQLSALETAGIGWRTAEGFGQIAFNHPLLQSKIPEIDSLDIEDIDEILNSHGVTTDNLQKETFFREEWASKLVDEKWNKIDKQEYDALARLLFVYRYQDIEELLQWLESKNGRPRYLGTAANLWGNDKKLNVGDKEPRLGKTGLALIYDLVAKLQEKTKEEQAIGLEILANRLSNEAAKQKGGDA